MTSFAAPSLSHAGRLALAFDEDEVTLAADAVRAAGLRPGARLASDIELPAWWWQGTGLLHEPACERRLRLANTSLGPVACVLEPSATAAASAPVHAGAITPSSAPSAITVGAPAQVARAPPDALANAALALARPVDDEAVASIERARNAPDGEADYPLGAFVTRERHDALLAERMRLPAGHVLSWTTIGAGAAPSEFARLQDAHGAYHVLLVELDGGGRTVGISTEPAAPSVGARVRPVVRRLYRQQGAWRHGVKFGPVHAATAAER